MHCAITRHIQHAQVTPLYRKQANTTRNIPVGKVNGEYAVVDRTKQYVYGNIVRGTNSPHQYEIIIHFKLEIYTHTLQTPTKYAPVARFDLLINVI